MRPAIGRRRRSRRRAFASPPKRPKLLPYMTTVSKRPKLRPDVFERQHARIQNAAPPRYVDGTRGNVYRHDFAAARLQFEGDASCAAASVEDAPAHEA